MVANSRAEKPESLESIGDASSRDATQENATQLGCIPSRYGTRRQCAQALGISRQAVEKSIRRGRFVETELGVDIEAAKKAERVFRGKPSEIFINGRRLLSHKQAGIELGISPAALTKLLRSGLVASVEGRIDIEQARAARISRQAIVAAKARYAVAKVVVARVLQDLDGLLQPAADQTVRSAIQSLLEELRSDVERRATSQDVIDQKV